MEPHVSVTGWLPGMRAGDHAAAQRLWEAYFVRLVGLARAKLAGRPHTLDDPEDVALSAFNSFCAAAKQGRFPKLNDRHDLWQVLVMLTARKAIDALRREQAEKRPPQPLQANTDSVPDIDQYVGAEPTPSFAAEVADEYRQLLDKLPSHELRTIAVLKLDGHTNEEIAAHLTRGLATVERKLAIIRRIWVEAGRHD
jgi:DNA-directed RNA polymerase specialized sigma24 family protein